MTKTSTCWLVAACVACGVPRTPQRASQPMQSSTTLPTSQAVVPAAPVPAASARPDDAQPSLSTFFVARTADGKTRPLVSGDTLHSGNHFWIELVAHESLIVWVVYASPDGSAAVIYPTSGEVSLTPGRTQRVPETQDFELDETVGWERLLIVASRKRLDSSAKQLAQLVEQVRATHRWPVDATTPQTEATSDQKPHSRKSHDSSTGAVGRPQPKPNGAVYAGPTPVVEPRIASADTRGLTRGLKLANSQAGRVDFQPDADGVIAIPLLLKHEP